MTHIYTGNGKGKSTAAFGLAVRAAMAGKRVYIIQFAKTQKYHETRIETYVKNIHIEQWPDALKVSKDLKSLWSKVKSHQDDLLILDEITISLLMKQLTLETLIDFIKQKPQNVELVLTGIKCPVELYDYADVVTEMNEVKHYYQKGVASREGFDC